MFNYGEDHLDVSKAIALAEGSLVGELTPKIIAKIKSCRNIVDKIASSDKAVYGINTGFGPLCDTQISPSETNLLQK